MAPIQLAASPGTGTDQGGAGCLSSGVWPPGVAHEINNPLGVIMANAEYLAEKHVGGAQVEAILAHGERAEASIRRLLNLAVMPEVRWESVNLTGLVRECILFLQPRLRKIKVTLRLPEWLPVRGEKGMLDR